MNRFHRNSRIFFVLFFAALLVAARAARASDTNFPGNVTVTSNLVVKGTLSVSNDAIVANNLDVTGALTVTNIGPVQPSASLYLSGADGSNYDGGGIVISGGWGHNDLDGAVNGGNVTITGGSLNDPNPGDSGYRAGNVIIQGGQVSSVNDDGGRVILQNSYSGGYVELATSNGVVRFFLQDDGTLNANNNAIVNLGALRLAGTTITNWSKAGVQPGGSTSLTLTNGTVINGASFASISALSATTISNVTLLRATTISGVDTIYAASVALSDGADTIDLSGSTIHLYSDNIGNDVYLTAEDDADNPQLSFDSTLDIVGYGVQGTNAIWYLPHATLDSSQGTNTYTGVQNFKGTTLITYLPPQGDLAMGSFTNAPPH